MIIKLLKYIFWYPFATFCYALPIVPLKLKIKEVSPGVELLIIDNFVTRVLSRFAGGFDYATFYIVDKEIVFDTGFSWSARRLKKHIQEDKNLDIKYIVNSHEHEDHIGNNIVLKDYFPKSEILAHPDALKEIIYPRNKPFYRNFLFGPDKEVAAKALPGRLRTTSQRELKVIHTPGHTPGHIVLLDPVKKILFSGDLFISEELDTQLLGADGPKWIESIENILKYEIELILDGHGVIIKGTDCQLMLNKKLKFLKELRTRTCHILSQGPITEKDLIKKMFNEPGIVNLISSYEGWMSVITGGDFSRSNLVRSFIDEFVDKNLKS